MGTVNDILREMCDTYAARLAAAYKRDMDNLREENERLKEALKPVLENVDTAYYTLSNAEDALDACKKAQRIYNGGEA